LSASLDAQTVTYRQQTFLNGPVYSGKLQATYTISPASSVRLTLGIASQRAKSPGFGNKGILPRFLLALALRKALRFPRCVSSCTRRRMQ
jgi:hypothetical protein